MNGRVAHVNPERHWTFWSRKWVVEPSGDQWELPFGTRYGICFPLSSSPLCRLFTDFPRYLLGTCSVLIRMAKDFGDDIIPLGDGLEGYAELSSIPAEAVVPWSNLLLPIESMTFVVLWDNMPVWSPGASAMGRRIIILMLPKSSPMSRRWTADMRSQRTPLGELLWAPTNKTSTRTSGISVS